MLQTGSKNIFKQDAYSQLETAIYNKDPRMMVPLRFISENFGINVDYNAANRKITLKESKTIVLEPNKKVVIVNGKNKSIDVAQEVIKGTTFVPIRFISEELGKKSKL